MDNREEQENEVEALECIFVDEFELLFNDPFKYEITLHTDRDDEDLDFIKVKLVIEYPLDYPLVVPKFQIKNLSLGKLTPNQMYDCENLFRDTAEEMKGEPMMFDITERIKEYLQGVNDTFVEIKEQEDEEARKREEEVKETFKGMIADTKINYKPVTAVSFVEWDEKFQAEMLEKKMAEQQKETAPEKKKRLEMDARLTGKQFFVQKNMVTDDHETFDEDEFDINALREQKREEEEKMCYDEELFDDEDVDDIDFD